MANFNNMYVYIDSNEHIFVACPLTHIAFCLAVFCCTHGCTVCYPAGENSAVSACSEKLVEDSNVEALFESSTLVALRVPVL